MANWRKGGRAVATQYYFRFRSGRGHCLQKVKNYLQTKFRRHISISSWDIASSGLEKLTFRPYHCNRHVILHQPVKFHRNQATCIIIDFQDGSRDGTILLPVSEWVMSLSWECQNLSSNQILWGYVYPRLRYNYFRFGKTNLHHIAISLPVLTLTNIFIIGMLFGISLPNFIETGYVWQSNDVVSIFRNNPMDQSSQTEHEHLQSSEFKGSMTVLVLRQRRRRSRWRRWKWGGTPLPIIRQLNATADPQAVGAQPYKSCIFHEYVTNTRYCNTKVGNCFCHVFIPPSLVWIPRNGRSPVN